MTRTEDRTVVIFGAGAVGRGFIGELFSEAGWMVSFLDVDAAVIDALNADAGYRHTVVGPTERTTLVSPVRAGRSTDTERVLAEILAADCIATSVGARVLPLLAPTLRDALLNRFDSGAGPVDILLCENLHGAAGIMLELLLEDLDDDRAAQLAANTGLVETSIGRMIPVPVGNQSPTDIAVEPYGFLPVDVAALRTSALDGIDRIIRDEEVDFSYYADRKLRIHNMGHFLCGLLGDLKGYEFLWQAAADPEIRYFTKAAMVEAATALAIEHDQPVTPLLQHIDDLLHRFDNKALQDPISRVIRDPHRKMAPDDRVIGAYQAAKAAGSPTAHLSLAVAAGTLALETSGPATIPARELDPLAEEQLSALRDGFDYTHQLELIGRTYDPPRIP